MRWKASFEFSFIYQFFSFSDRPVSPFLFLSPSCFLSLFLFFLYKNRKHCAHVLTLNRLCHNNRCEMHFAHVFRIYIKQTKILDLNAVKNRNSTKYRRYSCTSSTAFTCFVEAANENSGVNGLGIISGSCILEAALKIAHRDNEENKKQILNRLLGVYVCVCVF